MYLFYVDESGNLDTEVEKVRADGTVLQKDWLYVLTAVSLFEHRWHGFEKTINRRKRALMARIHRTVGRSLELADCEVKSNWIRIAKQRAAHPFLCRLTGTELEDLVELYYRQLDYQPIWIFSVVVDKRHLHDYMDQGKLWRKAWELLCESVELFMRARHDRHQAVLITDDVSKQMNRSLAMKHAYLQEEGTSSNLWLRHICEMPLFVRSELSNGIQLADLCSYNLYRAFRENDLDYPFFRRIAGNIWSCHAELPHRGRVLEGIRVFPSDSPLVELRDNFENERAPAESG